MLSLNHENINYFMTQILKLSCASFSYVNISHVLAQWVWTIYKSNSDFCKIYLHPRISVSAAYKALDKFLQT